MSLPEVIENLNQMQSDGVIGKYAIGGAIGATFYVEPVATMDVDVFVAFQAEAGSLLVSLQPLFDYFQARGNAIEKEYIIISGWPVQFLPPTSPLVEEALNEAANKKLDGTTVRVFTAEHLAAVALEVGRAKDKARLLQFFEADILDMNRFITIIKNHDLTDKWQQFKLQFAEDIP